MRTHILATSLLLVVPLATGCARARAATPQSSSAATQVVAVAGDCPSDAGPMRLSATPQADRNRDGYVCAKQVVSITGDRMLLSVDNDATAGAVSIVDGLYVGM